MIRDTTHYPVNRYSPGGSSGGSAAAAVAGIVSVAYENDLDSSVRDTAQRLSFSLRADLATP
ncbi:MAG: amidase family protein [Acidimicrobiales bacterium]